MKSVCFSLLFIFVFIINIEAQENKKNWTDGKLVWTDFQEKYDEKKVSSLIYILGYNTVKEKVNDTIVHLIKAYCYVDKNLSWIHPDYKTDQYLRYNQIIFDIAIIHREKLQLKINKVKSIYEIEYRFQEIFTECNYMIYKFEEESGGGAELEIIELWEKKLSAELSKINYNIIPKFQKRNFGYGFNIAIGYGILTGSLNDNFTNPFNIDYGFEFSYRKSVILLNATLGYAKVKKEYVVDKTWSNDKRADIAFANVSYGYTLVDNEKFRLTPFAGLGYTEFSEKNDFDEKTKRIILGDLKYTIGLNSDFKIRKAVSFIPSSFGVGEYVEFPVRTKISISRANLFTDMQGFSINLSIGVAMFGHFTKLIE